MALVSQEKNNALRSEWLQIIQEVRFNNDVKKLRLETSPL